MKKIDDILIKYPNLNRDSLIPVLQEIQDEFGYLTDEALEKIGAHIQLPASKIYGLATFYNQFTFKSRGKYHIRICNGSACHLANSASIMKQIHKHIGISDGETTRDGMFSLEVVACIGACGQSPVISINEEFYSRIKPMDIKIILEEIRAKHQ